MPLIGAPVLSEWEAAEVVRERADGQSITALAERHRVSERTVYRVLRRRFRCLHCRARFYTLSAALEHMYGPFA